MSFTKIVLNDSVNRRRKRKITDTKLYLSGNSMTAKVDKQTAMAKRYPMVSN